VQKKMSADSNCCDFSTLLKVVLAKQFVRFLYSFDTGCHVTSIHGLLEDSHEALLKTTEQKHTMTPSSWKH